MVNVIQFSRLSTDISVFIYSKYLSLGNSVICKGECHKILTLIDCSSSILCNRYYTPPLFIEVSEPSQEMSRSCICLPLSTNVLLDFGTVPTMYYLFFSLILAQIVSLYNTKPFHKSRQSGKFVFHFVTYLVYIYKTYIYLLM
jgi:hypothetical protein